MDFSLNIIIQIITAIISFLSAIAAIKTLVPTTLTYDMMMTNITFSSGWIVAFLLSLTLIYQDQRYKKQEQKHNKNQQLKNDNLNDKIQDKEYLKCELSRANISLNYLSSRLDNQRPIAKTSYHNNEIKDVSNVQ